MGNTKGWTEATSGDVVKLEEGKRIEGKYLDCTESVTYPDSFNLKLDVDGKTQVVFVNNIVVDLLKSNSVKQGDEIAVLFVGMRDNAKGTRKYKDFKLFVKK